MTQSGADRHLLVGKLSFSDLLEILCDDLTAEKKEAGSIFSTFEKVNQYYSSTYDRNQLPIS